MKLKRIVKERFSTIINYKLFDEKSGLFYNGAIDSWSDYGKTYNKIDDVNRAISMLRNNKVDGAFIIVKLTSRLKRIEF